MRVASLKRVGLCWCVAWPLHGRSCGRYASTRESGSICQLSLQSKFLPSYRERYSPPNPESASIGRNLGWRNCIAVVTLKHALTYLTPTPTPTITTPPPTPTITTHPPTHPHHPPSLPTPYPHSPHLHSHPRPRAAYMRLWTGHCIGLGFGPGIGLSPVRRQVITCTNAELHA